MSGFHSLLYQPQRFQKIGDKGMPSVVPELVKSKVFENHRVVILSKETARRNVL
jgi:hypothetical protein